MPRLRAFLSTVLFNYQHKREQNMNTSASDLGGLSSSCVFAVILTQIKATLPVSELCPLPLPAAVMVCVSHYRLTLYCLVTFLHSRLTSVSSVL